MPEQSKSQTVWPAHVPERWRITREEIWQALRESGTPASSPANDAAPAAPASVYVTMRDGVRLAVDVWPTNKSRPAPAIVVFTRYWRAAQQANGQRLFGQFGRKALLWNAVGHVLVVVDVRGAGASFGVRTGEYAPEEVRDYAEIIEWVAAQDWCDGFVVTEGGSYSGNAAELSAVCAPAALKATIPAFTDFDSYQSIACPGGVPNLAVMQMWGAVTYALDRGLADKVFDQTNPLTRVVGPMPVDEDQSGALRDQALAAHEENFSVSNVAAFTEFADDRVGAQSRAQLSLYAYRRELEGAGKPQLAWASWTDAATADGLIARFQTFKDAPIRGIIGAWAHLGLNSGDPFGHQGALAPDAYVEECAAFLDSVRRGELCRALRYYVIGADEWRTTPVWPPADVTDAVWSVGPGLSLSGNGVVDDSGAAEFTADAAPSTGCANRWHTQLGGGRVSYPRRYDGVNRLCFTSTPLTHDAELIGHPVVDIYFTCDGVDAVLHAALECVSPEGEITHLADGLLRAALRRASPEPAPYVTPDPYRAFKRADFEPLTPHAVTRLCFRLLPVAARVPVGHRLQLALTGADQDTFARFPDEALQHWCVHWGASTPSHIRLPMRRAS